MSGMGGPVLNSHFTSVCGALARLQDNLEIGRIVAQIQATRSVRGTVFLAGNGGSLSTALHFATDLEKVCRVRTKVLGANLSLLSALSNDISYGRALAEEIGLHRTSRDMLIAFSCSGASANIWEAIRTARMRNCMSVLITSELAPRIADDDTDIIVRVMSDSFLVTETCHLAICHAIIGMVGTS